MLQKLLIALYLTITLCTQPPKLQTCTQLNFLPMPQNITCNIADQTKEQIKKPCQIEYIIYTANQTASTKHIKQLIKYQMYRTFKCRSVRFGSQPNNVNVRDNQMIVQVQIRDVGLKSAFHVKQEAYNLSIARDRVRIQARHYVGFVRGLETFLQSITCNKHFKQCYMIALPIYIEDEPLYEFRGLLIDSSRHFLPTSLIKETIDAMMYNKLNILHWHIVDDDSFPLVLNSHPQLAEYAAFSVYERYSVDQIKDIVQYAMLRGVRIIPEIDTPGHAASWGKAPEHADIACIQTTNKYGSVGYKGPLDITLDKSYKLVKQIFEQVFLLFPDPYIHLGGDQVQITCLANKTEFIRLQGIQEQQLQLQYRKKQKKILRQLNSSKVFVYWTTDKIVPLESDDVVHWWGKNTFGPPIKHNKIILSPYMKTGQYYIDMGAGSIVGRRYYLYASWRDMYQLDSQNDYSLIKNTGNILGTVITLWSEISNMYTHHSKIWIRSSSMAQRIWSRKKYDSMQNFFPRIVAHEKLMNRRGIATSPATSQWCQKSVFGCIK